MKNNFTKIRAASIFLGLIAFTSNLQAIPTAISKAVSLSGSSVKSGKSFTTKQRFASFQDIFADAQSAPRGDYAGNSDVALAVNSSILFLPRASTPINPLIASPAFSAQTSGFAAMTGLALPQVPDGGNTVIMVGMSLLGLGFAGFIYRK